MAQSNQSQQTITNDSCPSTTRTSGHELRRPHTAAFQSILEPNPQILPHTDFEVY